MRRLVVLAAVFASMMSAAMTSNAAPAVSPQTGVIRPVHGTAFNASVSGNWFGYNVGAIPRKQLFKQVSGTWQVPTAHQHKAGEAENSSVWIGIGGGCVTANCAFADNTLIQAGTEQDVAANGVATYHSWYELIPAPSIQTPLVVRPGDKVHANIFVVAPGLWRIAMNNLTTRKSWSTTVPYSSSRLTAEWIAETPLIIGTGTGFAALPNLSLVHFDNALVNSANPHLKSSERVSLAPDGSTIIAVASAPQADGNGFGACTWATSCPVPGNF